MDHDAGEWAQRNRESLLHQWFEALRASGEPFYSADGQHLQHVLEVIFQEIVHWVMHNRFQDPRTVIDTLQVQQFPIRYREFVGIMLTGRRIAFDAVGEKENSDRAATLRVLRAVDDAFVQLNLIVSSRGPGKAPASNRRSTMDLVQHMRGESPSLKIVVITPYEANRFRHELEGLDIFECLRKPVKRSSLLEVVGRAMSAAKNAIVTGGRMKTFD